MAERQLPKLHTGVRFPSPAVLIARTPANYRRVITHPPKSTHFYVLLNVFPRVRGLGVARALFTAAYTQQTKNFCVHELKSK
jgi:hypothetical protein